MSEEETAIQEVMKSLDEQVSELSQEDYLETLKGLKSEIEIRIETVEQELESD